MVLIMFYIEEKLPNNITDSHLEILLDKSCYISDSITNVVYNAEKRTIIIEFSGGEKEDIIKLRISELFESIPKLTVKESIVIKEKKRRNFSDLRLSSRKHYNQLDLATLEALDKLFLNIARKFKSVIREYNSTLNYQNLNKNKYHENFPQNIFSIFRMPHEYKTINDMKEKNDSIISSANLISCKEILQPCVCYHVYDELTESKQIGTLVYTAKGRCYRNELKWKEDNFRKKEFNMREIVFIGKPEEVTKIRKDLLDEIWGYFVKLGLSGIVQTANDPFFYLNTFNKANYQLMSSAKYELLYERQNREFSAIASFNNCGNYLCRSYGIKNTEDQYMHSGCVALGLDRWLAALKDNFGENIENWPDYLIEFLNISEEVMKI